MTEICQRIANLSWNSGAAREAVPDNSAAGRPREPIAIIGAACRFPGEANDLDCILAVTP